MDNNPPQQVLCASSLWFSSQIINDVMNRLDISKNDKSYLFVRSFLRKELDRRILMSCWVAIQENHLQHFQSFSDSAYRANPSIDKDAVLVQFATLYPEIREKVFNSMNDFIKNFIENYRKVSALK